ncbi:response regulator transcription factor [Noviherbaspirillum suwonense]|uniref:DNA-binding response regulator, OmpR family, contains REC and winged-helix (WHTH) domain n=1 Tax=Noviherbaspirillum suwonense TaxID=1224511 RepID=A0ABY1PVE6_9BURK|nr:response regulator transcription factor [Noviherbaspirillum suwonense]SMP50184.1 DNA-binding response regulator, OmpR family, contains REC and winged-helix (wHTH) domain [Noviherbaspirillum suwonense]
MEKMIRVILVEDHTLLRNEIVSSLCAEGFEAVGVGNSTDLFLELLQKPCDVIVMDIGLPGDNGMAILQQLRSLKGQRELGIIMLTGRPDMGCRIECLAGGADAFLIKPVEIDELVAYIHNVYRRIHSESNHFSSLKWQFQYREWRLICPSGAVVELSHLESEFLRILVENAGNPVRRRDIIGVAFRKDPIAYDNRRMEAIVSRLRRKIHSQYPLSQPIKSVHSVGYVFTDSVRTL